MSDSPKRLSVQEVEDAALEALFQRGVQLRLYFGPFVFLAATLLIAWDARPWRLWLVGLAVALALTRLGWEAYVVRLEGLHRARLATLFPVPATLLLIVITSTGGAESPLTLALPLVTVFFGIFIRPLYGVVFAAIASVFVWLLTASAWFGWVPDFIPEAFGGGPRLHGPGVLMVTRALFTTFALVWGAFLGAVMRRAFQSTIGHALDARDEVLRGHEEYSRTLTTLAGEIAHELKNPLASVKGLAALVDRDATGKEKERLTVLRREVDRMQEILESFLNFSRPLVPLDLAPVKLAEVVDRVAALHEGMAAERGVEVRVDAKRELAVRADERKVQQILINLVQNALDVTPRGAAVDVVAAANGQGARVLVMDRGPGVKEPERVFEPGVTSKEKGNGLGLTIARLLARQHGGDVKLVPRDGGGTVAELTLPGGGA